MYNNSKRTILIPICAALCVLAGIGIGFLINKPTASKSGAGSIGDEITVSGDNKLQQTLSLISGLYVDPVDMDSLIEKAIPAVVGELDPHSVYIPASEMAEANEGIEGEFDGIGVVFNMGTDTIVVMNVIPMGPSDKVGIRSGDRIMKINDSIVAGQKIPQMQIVKRLRGKRGTTVNLSVKRQGADELIPFSVTRDIIPINSLDAAFMLPDGVGYVRLSSFAKTSYKEMNDALAKLRKQGMKKLIFDLRDNGGGLLDQAIYIANMFLPKGDMVVYTEDRFGNRLKEYSKSDGAYSDMPIVVMINENTASASEILAGALQDNDRGTVVGRRSFGKALVQRQIPYSDGSALRLTVARYYTPTGRSIQKPYNKGIDEYNMDIYNRYVHSEMFSADSIKLPDSLKFVTPKGKTVYGGGGIMPDVFVPLDTTSVTEYFRQVVAKNILYRFTMKYTDDHRARLSKVTSVDELNRLLDADTNLLNEFVTYAERNGVKPDWKDIRKSQKLIVAQLRAYIGRNSTLDYSGYFSNIYPVDETIMKSIEVLDKQ